mgnify:CR=1 FL=1
MICAFITSSVRLIALAIAFSCMVAICSAQSVDGFQINGVARGMSDSTLLYLEIFRDGKAVDSSYVVNEHFSFSGKVHGHTEYALLATKPKTDYRFVWLENRAMTFNGEKGSFRKSVLTGSDTEDDAQALKLSLEKIDDNRKPDHYAAFVESHPSSIISGHLLQVYATTWGKERSTKLYDALSAEVKDTYYGREVARSLSLNANPRLGDRYTDFTQPDVAGKPVRLSDLNGKVVLLEFWGSWCGPCRKSNPQLVKIYHEFSARGFEVLGVGSETNRTSWLNAIRKDQLPWVNVSELKGDRNNAAMIYGISYYPSNFLIDRNGIIVARDVSGNELRRLLRKHLDDKRH